MKIKKTATITATNGNIVDSLAGSSTTDAPSVRAVKEDLNTYSTEEKRIGTWLGKPLYRRVFTGTINDTEKWRFITDSGDIDKKIDTRGFINQGNSGVIVGIGEALSSEDSNLNYATRVIVVSNNLRLDCDGTKFANSPYEISIDYTKTTD